MEQWIRNYRDQWTSDDEGWSAVDELLDDYRLRADVGASLEELPEDLGS